MGSRHRRLWGRLETETTFATIGKEGVPEINLMSIQDFVAISLGKAINNNLAFGKNENAPRIFSVNYFLRDENDKFVNGIRDKHVPVKWMEQRIHDEVRLSRRPDGKTLALRISRGSSSRCLTRNTRSTITSSSSRFVWNENLAA